MKVDQTSEGVFACKNTNSDRNRSRDCYVDFDQLAMGGVPSKTPISILDTDYDNWAVVYACK